MRYAKFETCLSDRDGFEIRTGMDLKFNIVRLSDMAGDVKGGWRKNIWGG